MTLSRLLRRKLPPHLSEEIQAYMIFVGLAGMVAAPFLPLNIAVTVINEVSMVTLTVTGLAGLDAARNQGGNNGERH